MDVIFPKEVEDRSKGLELRGVDRFRYRTRYFTDSGIIGIREFVSQACQEFRTIFHPKRISCDERKTNSIRFSFKELDLYIIIIYIPD
jgi:putative transposase